MCRSVLYISKIDSPGAESLSSEFLAFLVHFLRVWCCRSDQNCSWYLYTRRGLRKLVFGTFLHETYVELHSKILVKIPVRMTSGEFLIYINKLIAFSRMYVCTSVSDNTPKLSDWLIWFSTVFSTTTMF